MLCVYMCSSTLKLNMSPCQWGIHLIKLWNRHTHCDKCECRQPRDCTHKWECFCMGDRKYHGIQVCKFTYHNDKIRLYLLSPCGICLPRAISANLINLGRIKSTRRFFAARQRVAAPSLKPTNGCTWLISPTCGRSKKKTRWRKIIVCHCHH